MIKRISIFVLRSLSIADNSSKINVYVRSELSESRLGVVSNDAIGMWKYASFDLPTCLSQFQIVIEGVIGRIQIFNHRTLFVELILLIKFRFLYEKETQTRVLSEWTILN